MTLADLGLQAHRSPADGLVENERVPWSPLQPEYGQRDYSGNDWAFAHAVKYPLACLAVRPATRAAQEQEQERLGQTMTRLWD